MTARALILLATFPVLAGFTPFSEVVNVCPKCPQGKRDLVSLTAGTKVACSVVAQNNDYYVVARHGEYRAVEKGEVSSVKWRGEGGAATLGTGDQILTKGGVVLHGAIVEEQAGRYLVIQVGSLKHVVWVSQIKSAHKGGKPYEVPQAPATP